jgi:hypothetical protein
MARERTFWREWSLPVSFAAPLLMEQIATRSALLAGRLASVVVVFVEGRGGFCWG